MSTIAEQEAPITQEELREMFGDNLPMEVVSLLYSGDDKLTVGQFRAKVREIAKRTEAPPLIGEIAYVQHFAVQHPIIFTAHGWEFCAPPSVIDPSKIIRNEVCRYPSGYLTGYLSKR